METADLSTDAVAKCIPLEVAEVLFCNLSDDPQSLMSAMLVCKHWKQCINASQRIWEKMCHERWPTPLPQKRSENFDPEPLWFSDSNNFSRDAKLVLNYDHSARKLVKDLQEAATVLDWVALIEDKHDGAYYLYEHELDRLWQDANRNCGTRFWAKALRSILMPVYG
jgi:F-box-like